MSDHQFTLDAHWESKLQLLASELESCLRESHMIHDRIRAGQESELYNTFTKLKDSWLVIGKAIKLMAQSLAPLFLLIGRKSARALKSYEQITGLWTNYLGKNIGRINNDKFEKIKSNVPDKKVLEARIEVAEVIFKLLENTKTVCETKIDFDADTVWSTKEIYGAQKSLQEIGLDVGAFNLVGKPQASYTKMTYKATLKEHGYDVQDVREFLDRIKPLIPYVDKKHIGKLQTTIASYFDDLAKKQLALAKLDNLDYESRDQQFEAIEIKTTRLWVISSLFKIFSRVIADIFDDVFKLCSIAEKSIPSKTTIAPKNEPEW